MASDSAIPHPNDWPVVRLGDIVLKIGSGATPRGGSESYLAQRTKYALIRSQNVFDRRFDSTGLAFITDEQAKGLQNVIVQDSDLLLNITGDGVTFSRCCSIPQEVLPACVNQHVSIIRVNPNLADAGYVLAFLTHPSVKGYIESFNAGGSRRAITKGHIESFRLPLPTIAEQRNIASFLRVLDEKIELNWKMNETLEAMARALFKSWYVNFDPVRAKAEGRPTGLPDDIAALFPDSFENSQLGEIPKGWTVTALDELTDYVLGGDWGSDASTDERPVMARCIRGADIPDLQRGGQGNTPYRYIKQSSAEKRSLAGGDLVIEISGGSPTQSTGRPVLINDRLLNRFDAPLICSNFCRLLRIKSRSYSEFVYFWLLSLYADDVFLQFENGTTGIKNFAFALFSATYKFALPPLGIADAFSTHAGVLLSKVHANAAESETLASVRDTLLPKLITGEIRIKHTERLREASV